MSIAWLLALQVLAADVPRDFVAKAASSDSFRKAFCSDQLGLIESIDRLDVLELVTFLPPNLAALSLPRFELTKREALLSSRAERSEGDVRRFHLLGERHPSEEVGEPVVLQVVLLSGRGADVSMSLERIRSSDDLLLVAKVAGLPGPWARPAPLCWKGTSLVSQRTAEAALRQCSLAELVPKSRSSSPLVFDGGAKVVASSGAKISEHFRPWPESIVKCYEALSAISSLPSGFKDEIQKN